MSTPANALDITQAGLVKFDGVSNFTGVTVTNHGTLIGAASNGITSLALGTSGQVLTSNGAGLDPSYQTISNSNLPGSGQITLSNGTNISVTGSPVSLGGTATINVTGPAAATTLTSNGVVIGNGSSAVTATAAGTTNTVLLGNTGLAPSFGTVPNAALTNSSVTLSSGNNITVTGGGPLALGGTATIAVSGTTNHAIQLGNASGSLTSATALTNGQLLIGSTGNDPVAATLTAGTGISIANAGGSITITNTASVSSVNWQIATLTLTSVQIKALHATPIQLIAAPGAGKVIVITQFAAKMVYGGTNAFTCPAGGAFGLFYNNNVTQSISDITFMNFDTLNNTQNSYSIGWGNTTYDNFTASLAENVNIAVWRSGTPEITGNAANNNTVNIQVIYYILNI